MKRWQIILTALVLTGAISYVSWAALASRKPDAPVSVLGSVGDKKGVGYRGLVVGRITELNIGTPDSYEGMTVFPIIAKDSGGMNYLTFDQAMKKGVLVVSEKGYGEVNMVRISNNSSTPVFIMDGEEIVGAKQNRILNSSVMIPANARMVEVPVSCVEHGRWVGDSNEFKSGGTALFARARQSNVAAVNRNYSAEPSAGAQSDQSRIWDQVGEKRAALKVGGAAGPMHEAYTRYEGSISNYVKHFEPRPGQVGAVFAVHGEVIGADIFDCHDTLVAIYPKLVKSYALDAIDSGSVDEARKDRSLSREDARDFLRHISDTDVRFSDYRSPGEGRDVRISGDQINGSSLVVRSTPVHISLFAPEDAKPLPVYEPGPIRPATERRNMRR